MLYLFYNEINNPKVSQPLYTGYQCISGPNVQYEEGGPFYSVRKALQKKGKPNPQLNGMRMMNGVVTIDGVSLYPEDFKECDVPH